jgi:hypothetical protein
MIVSIVLNIQPVKFNYFISVSNIQYRYYEHMAIKGRVWSDADKEMSYMFNRLRTQYGDKPMRSLAKDLGLTYSRVRDLLNQENGTPTLEEFLRICEHYDVEPTDMLNKILETDDNRSVSEPSATVDPSVSDSSESSASSAPTSADSGSAQSESSASSGSDVSSGASNNLDDDYVSHVADMIAADPSQFALMAHTDPNKFLESSTPRD